MDTTERSREQREYLQDVDLRAVVRRAGPLSVRTAVDGVLRACVEVAEAKTRPGHLHARASGEASADVWELGAMLYELLAGTPPSTPPASLTDKRSDVPPALEATVLLCLESDPAQRFNNVGELALALAAFGTPETAHACATRAESALKRAGVIATAAPGAPDVGSGGLWLTRTAKHVQPSFPAPHPETRTAAFPPPRPPPPRAIIPSAMASEPDVTFRVRRRSPALVTLGLLLGLAGICGAVVYAVQGDAFAPENKKAEVLATTPATGVAAGEGATVASPSLAATTTTTATTTATATEVAATRPAPAPQAVPPAATATETAPPVTYAEAPAAAPAPAPTPAPVATAPKATARRTWHPTARPRTQPPPSEPSRPVAVPSDPYSGHVIAPNAEPVAPASTTPPPAPAAKSTDDSEGVFDQRK